MKILITGATGFIGYRTALSLVKDNIVPVCLARKTSNISKLKKLGVEIEYCDITNIDEVRNVFIKVKPGLVIHSAAKVIAQKEELFEANVTGTLNVCKAALEAGVAKMVYLSSVAVINGNTERPLTDDMQYKATADYGESKIEAEKIVREYREKGLPSAIIRPCMVYGEDEPHALYGILETMKKWPILVPAEGKTKIEDECQLVYVDNVVELIRICMEKEEALIGEFIAADKEILPLREIIKIIAKELGNGRVREVPACIVKLGLFIPKLKEIYDQAFKTRTYDISRAVKILGYKSKISTEEGLKLTIRHYNVIAKEA